MSSAPRPALPLYAFHAAFFLIYCWFQNYGKVLEVGVGTAAPTFSNIAVQCRQTQDSDLVWSVYFSFKSKQKIKKTAFMDLAFTGGLAFVLELELIFGIPVMVMVHVKEISGRFVVHYTEKPITTISFAFLGMPKLDLHVESLILQHRFGYLAPICSCLCLHFIHDQGRRLGHKKDCKHRRGQNARAAKVQDQVVHEQAAPTAVPVASGL